MAGRAASDGGAASVESVAGEGETASRGPVDRDDDSVVVGLPAFPNQAAITAVVSFLTLATLSLLAGFLPVHNVAEYGPNDPASTPSLIMPDWFLMWGYGFLKLVPSWLSVDLLGIHVSSEFVGGLLLPGLVFAAVALWPFVDRSEEPVHFTADPLERPWQTAVGVAGVTFVMIASIAGMDVLVADLLGTTTDAVKPLLIAALVAVPAGAGLLTYATLGGFESESPGEGDRGDEAADAVDADGAEPGTADRGEAPADATGAETAGDADGPDATDGGRPPDEREGDR